MLTKFKSIEVDKPITCYSDNASDYITLAANTSYTLASLVTYTEYIALTDWTQSGGSQGQLIKVKLTI